MVTRRWMAGVVTLMAACAFGMPAWAVDEAADAMIKRVLAEVIDAAKSTAGDSGEAQRMRTLIDGKIMPNVDFARMTAAVVGRSWRTATPEQQQRLQDEFQLLLVRTYAGALAQLKEQTISVKPTRAAADDAEAIVRTLVKGGGEPIAIDYRLAKEAAGWRIVDLNVMGVWLVEAYRGQFSAEIGVHGIDGLIATLAERNRLVARAR